MTSWTNIPKPVGANYTNTNAQGKEQYDQASLTYDDSGTYYDGTDVLAWTDVPKPPSFTSSIAAGFGTGLLIPLTISSVVTTTTDPWTQVSKPIT